MIIYKTIYKTIYTGEVRNGNSGSHTGHPRTVPSMVQADPAYKFRRAVPTHLRPVIGQSEWTETLSRELAGAKRQLQGHIERTDRILALAEAGNWPEVNEEEIEALAEGWWRLFQLERSRLITNPQGLPSWPNGRERLDDINSEL
jgi:hypothetical protein